MVMIFLNVRFADDTTIIADLNEETIDALMFKLKLFCDASGNRISLPKSIMLGWDAQPPPWFSKHSL